MACKYLKVFVFWSTLLVSNLNRWISHCSQNIKILYYSLNQSLGFMELYVMYKDLFQPSFNVTQDFKEVRVIYLWKTKNNLRKIFSCYAKIPGAKQSSDCLNHCHQKGKKPANLSQRRKIFHHHLRFRIWLQISISLR